MDLTFEVFNTSNPAKSMTVTKGFNKMIDCCCTKDKQETTCNAYNVQIYFADLCRQLALDPQKDIYTSGDTPQLIRVWYPWDYPDGDAPKHTSTWWGEETDYDITKDPFAWIDRVEPMVHIPVHKGMPNTVGIHQSN
jgi:hypothetical protein